MIAYLRKKWKEHPEDIVISIFVTTGMIIVIANLLPTLVHTK